MNWNDIVQKVTPYVVKIETPNGHGTGFLAATIRIRHYASLTTSFIQANERAVLSNPKKDSAVKLCNHSFLRQQIPLSAASNNFGPSARCVSIACPSW